MLFARKHLKEPVVEKKILWTNETKIKQNDGTSKARRRRETDHDQMHTTASGNRSLLFIDDVAADRKRAMNSEVLQACTLLGFSQMLHNRSDSASQCKWIMT